MISLINMDIVKINFQQVSLKTLIPRIDTLKDTAVLNKSEIFDKIWYKIYESLEFESEMKNCLIHYFLFVKYQTWFNCGYCN